MGLLPFGDHETLFDTKQMDLAHAHYQQMSIRNRSAKRLCGWFLAHIYVYIYIHAYAIYSKMSIDFQWALLRVSFFISLVLVKTSHSFV